MIIVWSGKWRIFLGTDHIITTYLIIVLRNGSDLKSNLKQAIYDKITHKICYCREKDNNSSLTKAVISKLGEIKI